MFIDWTPRMKIMKMKKKISRIIGSVMIAIAIAFVLFAFNHPEMSFPWSNTITYTLYSLYAIVTVVLLIAPTKKCSECDNKNDGA